MDFTTPRKESALVIVLILFENFIKILKQIFLPLIAVFITGKKSFDYFFYFLIFITFISAIRSIIMYFRKHYYVDEDEFIVESGVLSNKKISIPLERIQSVGFEQNVIHRILKLRKLKIDTAGSSKSEIELNGLTFEISEALRDLLLKQKEAFTQQSLNDRSSYAGIENEHQNTLVTEESSKRIFSLNFSQLLKAGLFENHLRSLGIMISALFYIYTNANQVGIDTDEYVDKVPMIDNVKIYTLYFFTSCLIAVLISVGMTILNYYNLSFDRLKKGFKVKKGLLNSITISSVDSKIQTFTWADTWLKRKIGIFDLKLKQAGSKKSEVTQSIVIPGATKCHVDEVLGYLFPLENVYSIRLSKVHVSLLERAILFSLLFASVGALIAIFFASLTGIVTAVVAMFFLPYYHVKKFNKTFYGFNENVVFLKGGIFGENNIIFPIHKIQSIEKTQSPYQRRRGLTNLILYNASGEETIPYISEAVANDITNLFLYKVETDKKVWL
jgi:putative membrane protein